MTAAVITILLLVANSFFVAIEFALIAARRTRIDQLASEGNSRARVASAAMGRLSLMLSGSQLGITMSSLGLGYVAEPAITEGLRNVLGLSIPDRFAHPVAIAIGLSIVVFVHMVIAEMVPKSIAISVPEKTAMWLAGPMRGFVSMFRPVIVFLNFLANMTLKIFGIKPTDELVTSAGVEDVSMMLAASKDQGLIDQFEHRLLTASLLFPDRRVADIMVPRESIVGIDRTTTTAGAERAVKESGHSRLPVLHDGLDDVAGFVHAKDLLTVDAADRLDPIPDSLIRDLVVLRGTASLRSALLLMRRERTHFAVVTDRLGRTIGVVTLEDLLEQLVGAIRDEHDLVPSARQKTRRRRKVR